MTIPLRGRRSATLVWWVAAIVGSHVWCASTACGAQDVAPPEVIDQYLRYGEQALQQDDLAAARDAFTTVLRFAPEHPSALNGLRRLEARRVMRETLERVKRQVVEQELQRQQHSAKLRTQAMDLAVRLAQEKAGAQARQDAQAQRQIQLARERQLKTLYQQGLERYRRGEYAKAIETLQQLALLDPSHALVTSATQLIARAEAKQAEQRVRLRAQLPPEAGQAPVPELERLLTAKRVEQETAVKFAKLAMKERRYDQALELLQTLLAQDPAHEPARRLLHQATLAKLEQDETALERRGELDDQQLMNDVSRAELLTPEPAYKKPSVQPASASEAAAPVLSRLREPISFDFQDVAFSDVLDFLADSANVSIIPSPRIDLTKQRVSLRVDQLPLEMALKYLVKRLDLAYRADGRAILIATPEEFDNEPLETRVFFLRSGLGPFALETSAAKPNTILKMESFQGMIEQAVTQPSGSKLVVDERSGSIILTNTAENLRKVERLLSQLDVTPTQVLIEARFVEVTLTELEQRALEGVLTGDYALTKKGTADNVGPGLESQGPGHILTKAGGFKFPALSREDEGANITLQGILNAFQFESVLHLLGESQKGKTLSAPQITTLNNQPASIKVVDEFRYPTRYEVSLVQFDVNGDGDFEDAGETEFVNVPQDFQKRDVGILLNVTPSVGGDLKTITLVIAPEVSQFSGTFKDLGGDVKVPEFTSSQLTTSVVIQDGQTVVLGGLMKDSLTEQLTKVPVLGDIPVLG
ncbi:MAG: hypothetical protein HYY91_02420, partial [Candidatus Omnitrophica bacterium]|nr:hypothetical protein [Candidatus Omnitrophota bacterium]